MKLVGIDIGTTCCKVTVFNPDGAILGYGFREYGMVCDEPAKAEQDAELVYQRMLEACREAVHQAGRSDYFALAVSVQGDAVIPINREGAPLYSAVLGMDYRSAEEAKWCQEKIGSWKLFEHTGMCAHPINSVVKILWIQRHRPDVYRKAWKIVTYSDFLLYRLCRKPVIDMCMASRTMGFDLQKREWASDILDDLGMDLSFLSKIIPSGEVAGELEKEVAEETGLPYSLPVVAGGHDASCASLGAGADHEGIGVLAAGTADVLCTVFSKPQLVSQLFDGMYPCYIHCFNSLYITFSLNHVGGILFHWFRDTLCAEECRHVIELGQDPYDYLVQEAGDRPSPVMVLPHFNGSGNPICDMESKGAIVGLTLGTKRGDLIRAILESLSFELKINVETMEKAGIHIDEIRVVGGGAKSRCWLQVRADILGRPVSTVRVREASCLGAAILAGVATGVYSTVGEGVDRTVEVSEVFEPNERQSAQYNDRFSLYRRLYPLLKEMNRKL